MLNEFKAFVLRGNVVDLAVGVVIGAAFAAVVISLVEDVLTPFLAVFGERNFDELSFGVGVRYGNFLNNVLAFLLIAAAVFFLVVKPVNALMARRKTEPDVEAATAPCPHCLSNIPESARVCAFCTRDVVVKAPERAAPVRKRRPPATPKE
jgi:large conductance mechanosensitive channel